MIKVIYYGNQVSRGAELDGGHDFLKGGIEIQGRLIGEHRIAVKADGLAQRLGVIDDRPMAGGHSLGHAGRARGEHHVDGIGVDLLSPHLGQGGLVGGGQFPALGGADSLPAKKLTAKDAVFDQLAGGFLVLFIADEQAGLEGIQDQPHTGGGHVAVQGGVEASRVEDTEEGGDGVGMLVHEHRHGLAGISAGSKSRADGAGMGVELTEGQPLGACGKGQLIRHLEHRFFQVLKNIIEHNHSDM